MSHCVRGAVVVAALWLNSLALAAQPAATLQGVVFDSVGNGPLAGAVVRVFRSNDASDGINARTDHSGRFTIPSLRTGTWLLSFLHPRLDALRLEPPLARVEVVEAGDIDVTLAVPSGATLARVLCGANRDDSTTVVVGDVRDAAARTSLAGATVKASWPEWVFGKKRMEREVVARVSRTDSTGQFVLCNVPQNTTVTALAYMFADSTGIIELAVPAAEYTVADFVLDRSRDTSSPDPNVRFGRGILRGNIVTADGKPFVNAIARVLGNDGIARSDSTGAFRILNAMGGTQTLEVRAVGYEPQRLPLVLRPGEVTTVHVALAKSGTILDTVRVLAGREVPKQVERIEARWKQGLGLIMDAATIRERTSTTITSALWNVPGIRLGPRIGPGSTILMRGMNGQECQPRIFLDGYSVSSGVTLTTARNPNLQGFVEPSIDEIVVPSDVLALEVYDNALRVPPEYYSGGGCGVVLVWTSFALGKVAPIDPRRRR